ncbi:MAG: STAS-like domain-containing protein [Pseudomonadota bacterium]
MQVISIAKDFSDCPAGRYAKDGPFSGERFRDELLIPALLKAGSVEVNLDGALGYGSSFLEEAFGGLVREKGYTSRDLHNRLQITSAMPMYVERIWSYIDDADRNRS